MFLAVHIVPAHNGGFPQELPWQGNFQPVQASEVLFNFSKVSLQ